MKSWKILLIVCAFITFIELGVQLNMVIINYLNEKNSRNSMCNNLNNYNNNFVAQ